MRGQKGTSSVRQSDDDEVLVLFPGRTARGGGRDHQQFMAPAGQGARERRARGRRSAAQRWVLVVHNDQTHTQILARRTRATRIP